MIIVANLNHLELTTNENLRKIICIYPLVLENRKHVESSIGHDENQL